MKKLLLIILLSCMLCLLIACQSTQQSSSTSKKQPEEEQKYSESKPKPWMDEVKPMEMEGYVFIKETAKLLVVNPEQIQIANEKVMYHAVWFSHAGPETVEIGDRVQATYEHMMTSYPGQSEAIELTVLESVKPAGADLTEAEAIRKSLKQHKRKLTKGHILSQIEYEKASDTWNIQVTNINDDSKIDISVKD